MNSQTRIEGTAKVTELCYRLVIKIDDEGKALKAKKIAEDASKITRTMRDLKIKQPITFRVEGEDTPFRISWYQSRLGYDYELCIEQEGWVARTIATCSVNVRNMIQTKDLEGFLEKVIELYGG